jgi:internalin A
MTAKAEQLIARTQAESLMARAREELTLDLEGLGLDELPESIGGLTQLTTLNLSGNNLTALPEWLGSLNRLSRLDLADNQLTSLPATLGNLRNLTALDIRFSALTVLPEWFGNLTSLVLLNLAGNRLSWLPASMRELVSLNTLNLYRNRFVVLPDCLANLKALTTLHLSGNQLSALPDWLGGLKELTSLNAADNHLTTIPESIGELRRLARLNLSSNQLTALPESLGNLKDLVTLDLRDNELIMVPACLGGLPRLVTLDLNENDTLKSPSRDERAGGTAGVLTFLRALLEENGGEEQWLSKMLVVGEPEVGKTSVTKRLCGLDYDPDEPKTHGVHVDPLLLAHPARPGIEIQLNVWDFGGQLEYRATQRFYLTDRSLFLLVWNARRPWRDQHLEAWLDAITDAAPDSPIVVTATHSRGSTFDIDEGDLRRRYPRIAGFFRVDCDDPCGGIEELREEITKQAAALPLMGQRWPPKWTRAAQRLASEPSRYITLRHADGLMAGEGIDDAAARKRLLSILHDRGEVLHYPHDPELRETVVLKPAWVDEMIIRVLDSQEVIDRGGLLSRDHRAELWHDLDDPGLSEMLTALMEHFDLAYRVEAPDREEVALVVERLPAGRPAALAQQWESVLAIPDTRELRLTYALPTRQAGIPSWFIAREHRFSTGVAWARGALLWHRVADQTVPGEGRSFALVEDDDQAQPKIRLTVRGAEPHAFYSILDEGFTGIISKRYPGMEVHRLIPCICRSQPCGYEFDYETAVLGLNRGKMLQCQRTLDDVDPRTLLMGIQPRPIETTLARIVAAISDTQASARRIEHAQLQVLDTVRDLLRYRDEQGALCPSIFTVTKRRRRNYELRLYCEQPDAPHPLPGDAGVYHFTGIPSWLRNYAPYLLIVLTGLRIALPLISPALGAIGQELTKAANAQLELSCKLLEDLASPSQELRNAIDAPELQTNGRPRPDVDFAQLSAALHALDPNEEWGGLRQRQLPETGQVVYLCWTHRQGLRYPAAPAE